MKPEFVQRQDHNYVVVDLPIRLTDTEFAKLNAVAMDRSRATQSRATQSVSPFHGPGARVTSALDRAFHLIEVRKRREELLGANLFGEPAWDILLDLFVQRIEGRKTSSTSASIASRAPTTTALRYIAILVNEGLVTKRVGERDLRVQYVELSDKGYRHMLDLLAD